MSELVGRLAVHNLVDGVRLAAPDQVNEHGPHFVVIARPFSRPDLLNDWTLKNELKRHGLTMMPGERGRTLEIRIHASGDNPALQAALSYLESAGTLSKDEPLTRLSLSRAPGSLGGLRNRTSEKRKK